MRYEDFVDTGVVPEGDELICDFYLEVEGMPFEKGAGGVAAESSVGTWTDISTFKDYVEKLKATVFDIEGNRIKISYPISLFEGGNMANILSSVAGNVFGLKEIVNLRLVDIHFPKRLIKSFKGPKYGIDRVRDVLKVRDRPLLGTIVKPKLGLNTVDHVQVAYDAWAGGCDIVKDDENLSSQKFNPFEDRVLKTLEARDRAEEETGETKVYMANVTAETEEMIQRAEFIEEHGGRYLMVDILTAGWSALQTIRNHDFNLVIHAHRAGHAALTKNEKHGISMPVIAKISRIIGVDQLHVGAAVGKMTEGKAGVKPTVEALLEGLHGVKKVFPVASGGVYPSLVPEMFDFFGKDFVCQAGGGIHGHPDGTIAGATAMRQAIQASLKGISLNEYAGENIELKKALQKWGYVKN